MSTAPLAHRVTVVVPTIGRPSLARLLDALADFDGTVIVVDDRPGVASPLETPLDTPAGASVRVVAAGGRGPAHARNVGWRRARTPWIAFLDDDVVPGPGWLSGLSRDLDDAESDRSVVGISGRIVVPAPTGRRPRDRERATLGLVQASWVTADFVCRRDALMACGGFDERFARAYREDADLALRLQAAGGVLTVGERITEHPLREDPWWVSLGRQRGNADDMLMRRLHGRHWRRDAQAPAGLRRLHMATTTMLTVAAVAGMCGRRRTAAATGISWAACVSWLAWHRFKDGPWTPAEAASLAVTSVAIGPLATVWTIWGAWRFRRAGPWRGLPAMVIFDRDGTVVIDVPYNNEADRVRPIDGAAQSLARLREEGLEIAIASNQAGVAMGLITLEQLDEVNARVEELLGPFSSVVCCVHGEGESCDCRKPRPGLIQQAMAEWGVTPARCIMIGDLGTDVDAALAAGVPAILIPNERTPGRDLHSAPVRAASLQDAVNRILTGGW